MKSFENSAEMLDKNSSENEAVLNGIEEGEARTESRERGIVKPENTEKSVVEKSDSVILAMRENLEIKEKETSFKKLVAEGAVSFAVIAALMSAPQFNPEAMAAENDIATELNKEFSEFADKDLAERKSAMHFVEDIEDSEDIEDTEGYMEKAEGTEDMEEDDEDVEDIENVEEAESEYLGNAFKNEGYDYSARDRKLKDVAKKSKEASSSIDILPEGGAMVNFSGSLENVGQIPVAFIDNLKEIKDDPYKFISEQVLNMAVNGAKRSAENSIDEHNAEGESYLSY